MANKSKLSLEDFKKGSIFSFGKIKVSYSDIIDYAQKFDPQFFHLDKNLAKESIFGEVVASGWHTASVSMRLFVEACGNIDGGMIGKEVKSIKWPRPVYPNDMLSIKCEVKESKICKSKPELALVKMTNTTYNQKDEIVMIADIVMFISSK